MRVPFAALVFAGLTTAARLSGEGFNIIPIYHASAVIETGTQAIYVDPWCKGDFSNLPKADLVLITDIHPDHMDADCVAKIKKPDATVIAPAAVAAQMPGVQVMANGETTKWGKWTIQAIPMYNLERGPAPGKFYHDKGRGNGYVLALSGQRIYFSGDTENIPEMRALKHIDFAFVCMNLPFTMTPEEAAAAVKAFHPKVVYPYHYRNGDGTFADLKKFEAALAGTGIEVRSRDWYGGEQK